MSPGPVLDSDTAIPTPADASKGGSEASTNHYITALLVGTGVAALLVTVLLLIVFIYRRKMRQNSRKPGKRVISSPYKPDAVTVPVFVTRPSQCQSRLHLFSQPQKRPVSQLLSPTEPSTYSSASASDSDESGQSSRNSSRTSFSSRKSLDRINRREKGVSDLRRSSSAPSSPRPRQWKGSPLVPSFYRSPHGRILFLASYDAKESAFQVTVISAAGLPEIIPGKGCNSFVKVYLAPDNDYHQRRTQTVKHSRYPRFDSTFIFKEMEMEDLIQRTLVMHICHQADQGITHKNTLIGIASVGISAIQSEILGKQPTWIYLTNGRTTSDTFQNSELEVTLCLSNEINSLTVVVNKVAKIPSQDATAVSVSCQVCCNHRTIYKTRTTKVSSTQPVFHHQKSFDITGWNLEDIELHFRVKAKKGLNKRRLVGEAVIGPRASSHSGRDHWTKVLDRRERQVSKCHRLTLHQEEDFQ